MKPLRVLMVVRLFYPWIGGAERQAHKLAKKLMEKGIRVQIVTGWWFRGTPQRDMLEDIPIFRNHTMWHMFDIKGLRRFGGYLYILSLLWYLWLNRENYEIIHVHSLSYHTFAASLAGRWFNRRTIVKLANSGRASDILKMRNNQQLPGERYLLSAALGCDRFVATNKTIAHELISVGVPAEKIVRLPNGVETDLIETKPSYVLNDPIRLVFLGRLHEQKGLDVLLKAFQSLLKQHPTPNIHLQLLGDGPSKNDLTHLSRQLGIDQHVDFMGQLEQVYEHLRAADIFILPSRAEGMSNALLEAMACGLPVIVSDIPGNVDVVEDQKNGLVFTAEDPDSLVNALASLIGQPELRGRLGRAARQTVESRFDLNLIVDRYIELYQELLSTKAFLLSKPLGDEQIQR